jgi:subtilisin family serine protease
MTTRSRYGYLPAGRGSKFSIEQLESRQLLSSAPTSDALDGLVPIRYRGAHVYAAPGQWVVMLNRPSGSTSRIIRQINEQLSGEGIRAVRRLNNRRMFLFRGVAAPIDQVRAKLAKLPRFIRVEPDIAIFPQATTSQSVPNDPDFATQWGLNQTNGVDINAPEAWSLSTGSNNIVIAQVDTGMDYTHPDLAANTWTNPGEVPGNGIDDDGNGYIDDVHGWDFANGDPDPMDDNGHGTATAGVMAAAGNNSVGMSGVNWHVSIMPLKFIAANGAGMTSNAVAAINYANMMKSRGVNVRVVNNSTVNGGYTVSMQIAIDSLNSNNILIVAAAGNGGSDYIGDDNDSIPSFPSGMPQDNVIAVAATDGNDALASFSNFGATSVDLAAPGVNILSTAMGGGYGDVSGTSFATPFVSGAVALAYAYAPGATASQVKAAILGGADRVTLLAGKCVSGGRLDIYNMLNFLSAPAPAGSGLTGRYYDNKDFTGASLISIDPTIDFNWGTAAPKTGFGADTFSVRWTGQIQPQYSETYAFYTRADDGVRLWINGQPIIDRWSNHPSMGDLNGDGIVNQADYTKLLQYFASSGAVAAPYDLNSDGRLNALDLNILASNFGKTVDPVTSMGTIFLNAGQKYDITYEYYENYGVASSQLSWSSPSTPKAVIPSNRLYPA